MEVVQCDELILKNLILERYTGSLLLLVHLAIDAEQRALQAALTIEQELEQSPFIRVAVLQVRLVVVVDKGPL